MVCIGTATFSGAVIRTYVAKTATYAVLATDYVVDCTSGTFTVTLPTAVGVSGKVYNIKNSGTGVITVATTVCKYGAGVIHRITINTAGTLCTIYDNTSAAGSVVGIIDTNKTTGVIGTMEFGLPFAIGLTLVTTGAGTDITCIYE